MSNCINSSFKENAPLCYTRTAAASAIVLLVTLTAITVILACAPIGSDAFTKVGGYPLLYSLMTLGGISLVSFAIFNLLSCKRHFTASKQEPLIPEQKRRSSLSNSASSIEESDDDPSLSEEQDTTSDHEVIESSSSCSDDAPPVNPNGILLQHALTDLSHLAEEISEQPESSNHDIVPVNSNITTMQAPLTYQSLFDQFIQCAHGEEIRGKKKARLLETFEKCNTLANWEQFREELQEAMRRGLLNQETATHLFRSLLPQKIIKHLTEEIPRVPNPVPAIDENSQKEQLLIAEMQHSLHQLFDNLIPYCGRGYDANMLKNALDVVFERNDYDKTRHKVYYFVILLPFFIRTMQSMHAANGEWKEGTKVLFQQFITLLKIDKDTLACGYFLETISSDFLEIVFSIVSPLKNLLSDNETQANRALIDFICGHLAAYFALVPSEEVQKNLIARREFLQSQCQSEEASPIIVFNREPPLEYAQELVRAFNCLELNCLPQVEEYIKEKSEYLQKQKEEREAYLKKRTDGWSIEYLFHKFFYAQINTMIKISFFQNEQSDLEEYIKHADQMFSDIEIFNHSELEEP